MLASLFIQAFKNKKKANSNRKTGLLKNGKSYPD